MDLEKLLLVLQEINKLLTLLAQLGIKVDGTVNLQGLLGVLKTPRA